MTASEPGSASSEPKSEAAPDAAASASASGDTPKSDAPSPVIALPMLKPMEDDTAQAEEVAEPTPRRFAALAAGIALAVTLGAVAGALAMAGLGDKQPSAAAVAAEATRDLQATMAKLEAELASLKASLGASQRSAGTQFAKLNERLERAEKAQAEPAARIAKIAESLDRVERKLPALAAHADVTGSIVAKADAKSAAQPAAKPEPKQETRPPLAEGWHLLDLYRGRAVVENRAGRLFEVGPGSNLPGLGRVEEIKRENGKVVVVTRNGVIAGLNERRPRAFFYRD